MKSYAKMNAEIVKLLRLRDCDATAQYAAVRIEELERSCAQLRMTCEWYRARAESLSMPCWP